MHVTLKIFSEAFEIVQLTGMRFKFLCLVYEMFSHFLIYAIVYTKKLETVFMAPKHFPNSFHQLSIKFVVCTYPTKMQAMALI